MQPAASLREKKISIQIISFLNLEYKIGGEKCGLKL